MQSQCHKVRIQALKAWMELQGVTYRSMARELNCSEQFVSQALRGLKKMPLKRRQDFIKMGLPEHLLPASGKCRS